jgi:hypothetical protein
MSGSQPALHWDVVNRYAGQLMQAQGLFDSIVNPKIPVVQPKGIWNENIQSPGSPGTPAGHLRGARTL